MTSKQDIAAPPGPIYRHRLWQRSKLPVATVQTDRFKNQQRTRGDQVDLVYLSGEFGEEGYLSESIAWSPCMAFSLS